jgi:hypothetical protein
MANYKTKTQKMRALKRLENTAQSLYLSGAMSLKDLDGISKIVKMRINQLK